MPAGRTYEGSDAGSIPRTEISFDPLRRPAPGFSEFSSFEKEADRKLPMDDILSEHEDVLSRLTAGFKRLVTDEAGDGEDLPVHPWPACWPAQP